MTIMMGLARVGKGHSSSRAFIRAARPFMFASNKVSHPVNQISSTLLTLRGGSGASVTQQRHIQQQQKQKRHMSTSSSAQSYRVYIAVGSNLGDRFGNIAQAIQMLCGENSVDRHKINEHDSKSDARLINTSFLHETPPMYLEDQPRFLNGAVEIETSMEPQALLRRLKEIETDLGRNQTGIRNGPRPVDLDILLYEEKVQADETSMSDNHHPLLVNAENLLIPHPRIDERDFVLAPLCEVAGPNSIHPVLDQSYATLYDKLLKQETLNRANSSSLQEAEHLGGPMRVIPLPRGRMLTFNETVIMGILNVTPDSFSDGGKWTTSVEVAIKHALQMHVEGAAIIDIGGESTRPGAKEVAIEEQIQRTIPVIRGIREVSDIPISIDTRHAAVAKAAIEAGADIVNDVSGGIFDPEMFQTVAALGVPIILMHMRGTPETMNKLTHYDDVVEEVAHSLLQTSLEAEKAGIPRWLQILDPGIGFAKDMDANLSLLKHMNRLRDVTRDTPLLLGTSRKRFIGTICGQEVSEERDVGSISSCVTALSLEGRPSCNILRVHNVKAAKHAALVMDAIISYQN